MQLPKVYQKCKTCPVGDGLLHCVVESVTVQDITLEQLSLLAKRLISKSSGIGHILTSYYGATVKGVSTIEFISPYVGWSIQVHDCYCLDSQSAYAHMQDFTSNVDFPGLC